MKALPEKTLEFSVCLEIASAIFCCLLLPPNSARIPPATNPTARTDCSAKRASDSSNPISAPPSVVLKQPSQAACERPETAEPTPAMPPATLPKVEALPLKAVLELFRMR